MLSRELVMLIGLALAAWGHLLVNDLLGAGAIWVRLDEWFPPTWRSDPPLAGMVLLAMGIVGVCVPAVG